MLLLIYNVNSLRLEIVIAIVHAIRRGWWCKLWLCNKLMLMKCGEFHGIPTR